MKRVRRILLELCQWAALGGILILVVYGDRRSCVRDGDFYQSVRDCALAPMQWAVADFDEAIVAGFLAIRGLASEQLGDAVRARADFEATLAARPENEAGAAPLRFLVRSISERVVTAGLARLAKATSAPSSAPTPTVSVTTHGAPSPDKGLPVEIVPMVRPSEWTDRIIFSPDGRMLATESNHAGYYEGNFWITLWEIRTGRLLRTFKSGIGVESFSFSQDSRTISVTNYRGVVEMVPSRRWLEIGWRSLRVAQPERFQRWRAGMETTP